MNDEYDDQGKLTPDHLRITKIGKFLRYFSIDELPNIINVLKGDMSLVGPRPYPVKYRDIFSNYQKKRFIVRPGITGLAQINGRNKLNWYSKTEYDLQYIEKLSFLSDLAIIFRTFFIFAGKHSDPNFDGQSFDTYLPRINGEDL
jgi:lipopolysaccharide/colanic/teichoic acid biosynthesis glycosyltransferase